MAAILVCIPTLYEYSVYRSERISDTDDFVHQLHNFTGQTPVPDIDIAMSADMMTFEKPVEMTSPEMISSIIATSDITVILECSSHEAATFKLAHALFLFIIAYVGPTILIWINYGRLIHFIITHNKISAWNDVTGGGKGSGGRNFLAVPQPTNQLSTEPSPEAAPKLSTKAKSPQLSRNVFRRKVKVVKMLVAVAALFQACWLPYFTLLLYTV